VSQADTLKYWSAMQSLRDSQPIVPGAVGKVVAITCDLSGSDDIYPQRCPPAWLEFAVQPSPSSAQLCFPREYYQWCLRYLNQALSNEPALSASAEARVVWTLDVWAHVSYALFALNLNWSDMAGGYVDTRFTRNRRLLAGKEGLDSSYQPGTRGATGLVLQFAEIGLEQSQRLIAAKRSALDALWKRGGSPGFLRDAEASSLLLSPFSTLPIFWVGKTYARASTKRENTLWGLLLDTVQPWSASWSSRWLGSKDNRDKGDVQFYAADPPMAMAVMQWRLFAARDFAQSAVEKQSGSEMLLSQYLAGAAKSSAASIDFLSEGTGVVAVPALRWGAEIVRAYAAKLLTLDYGTVLSTVVADHIAAEGPRMMPNGSAMTIDQEYASRGQTYVQQKWGAKGTELSMQHVTAADYKDLAEANQTALNARAQAAARNPSMDCGNGALCDAANVGLQQSLKYIKKVPVFGQVVSGMLEVGSLLMGVIGVASGATYWPFKPLTSPVARTLTAAGWSFAPTGSTMDIWVRWGVAAANYESLLPGLFTAKVPAVSAPRKPLGTCVTESIRVGGDEVFCTVCKDEALPACAKHMPAYAAAFEPAKLPALTVARNTAATSVVDSCNALALQWALDNPQYSDCVTVADLPMWQQICRAVSLKQLTIEAGVAMWAQYVVNVKACGLRPKELPSVPSEPGTLWSVLTDGVVHGVNPLRALSASRAFTGSVLSPFNPLRSFLGGRS